MNLQEELEKIEPWLTKQLWSPIEAMMIPSVLKGADELIFHFSKQELNKENQIRLEKLKELRKNFKRKSSRNG